MSTGEVTYSQLVTKGWAPRKQAGEAGRSRLLSGQKRAGFCRCKPALLLARKEPAFAGFRRLCSVAPKGKEPAQSRRKPAPFLARRAGFSGQSRLFLARKKPALAERSRLWPKKPALAKEAGFLRPKKPAPLAKEEAGFFGQKPASLCTTRPVGPLAL